MGIWWSCCASQNANQEPGSKAPKGKPEPVPEPYLDEEANSSFRLIDGDSSFLRSRNFSGNSFFSMVTTNFSAWISQASGAIAGIWDNNAGEGNDFPTEMADEFPAEMDDDTLPNVGITFGDSKLRAFTFAEMKAATFNFRPNMVLGLGGFGSVYKGWLKQKLPVEGKPKKRRFKEKVPPPIIKKRPIAVKRLDSSSKQGIRQWQTEVGFLGKLSHPNIIKLLGYCRENEELLIVYEFMPKASLNYHLFGKHSRTLPWNIRIKIMAGTARGLCHLHNLEKPIVYRDFKSSNILLDEDYTPKLSDFGLAKWGPADGESFVRGHVMGTYGYADPEYVKTGNFRVKSDVYSFGVVLLEMLTGLRAIDKKRSVEQRNLVKYATADLISNKRKFKRLVDPKLEGKYPLKEARTIGDLARVCLLSAIYRPSMKEVVDTLEKLEARYETQVTNFGPDSQLDHCFL